MAFTVRKVKIRSTSVCDEVGALARALKPLSEAAVDLEALVGYVKHPGDKQGEIFLSLADSGKRAAKVAQDAGFTADAASSALVVEGDNKPGIAQQIAEVIAATGLNLRVCIGLTAGKKFTMLLGFDDEADATKAAGKLRAAGAPKRTAKKAAKKA